MENGGKKSNCWYLGETVLKKLQFSMIVNDVIARFVVVVCMREHSIQTDCCYV